ncbi:MAG: UDP-N-acetylmuramoyl-tripeptide--D-alanyl-D-alanine ligase [Eubacteriales bacterium]|nr:UDP-N-acetylmuramoyl-tripeptide--D-alanyl-D-alanine ligase [Eubacteriales bacterium]
MLSQIALILLWYAPAVALMLTTPITLMYFQLSSYQFRGFLSAVKRQRRRVWLPGVALSLISLVVCFLSDLLFRLGGAWKVLAPLIGALIIVFSGKFIGKKTYLSREGKSSLNFTTRIKRFYAALFILLFVVFYIVRKNAPMLGINALMVLPLPIWVFLAAILVWPVERLVYELYFQDAKRILKERDDVLVIGVTGSYGKTSVKFFIKTLLDQKYNVLCSRGSQNTPMGIATCIRNDLMPSHNVFVAELGARHRGDIKELCRLLNPKIGVLTSVGPQHLETFGSLEAVKQTKYDLIRALPKDGFAVFGEDHALVHTLYEQTRINKAIAGDNGEDIWAEDLQETGRDTQFTLCTKQGKRIPVRMHLRGAHFSGNALIAAAVALHLNLSDRQIMHGMELLYPIRHRFKVETGADGVHRINNGYNANPVSSEQTLAELKKPQYNGRRIVVTPGFVELGFEEERYNRELGANIAATADIVLLVGKKRTLPIAEGLINAGFNAEAIHSFDSLKEANAYYETIKAAGDYVLYENDLPDHYSEV